MKKKVIILLILLAGTANLFSRGIKNDIELRTGLAIDMYSDFSSVMSVNEGLLISGYYNILRSPEDSPVCLGLDLGIKSGLLLEGANSMRRPFIPEFFPMYIPLCPAVQLHAAAGPLFRFHLFATAGPYLTLYDNLIPDFRLNLDAGIGLSFFCFEGSGLSLELKSSGFGKGDYWTGAGLNLLYILREKQ